MRPALAPDGIRLVPCHPCRAKTRCHTVPGLEGVCSLPRQNIEVVVTGTALRGRTLSAERLINVAAEQNRGTLRDA